MFDAPLRAELIARVPFNIILAWGWWLYFRIYRSEFNVELYKAYDLGRQDERARIVRNDLLDDMLGFVKSKYNDH